MYNTIYVTNCRKTGLVAEIRLKDAVYQQVWISYRHTYIKETLSCMYNNTIYGIKLVCLATHLTLQTVQTSQEV